MGDLPPTGAMDQHKEILQCLARPMLPGLILQLRGFQAVMANVTFSAFADSVHALLFDGRTPLLNRGSRVGGEPKRTKLRSFILGKKSVTVRRNTVTLLIARRKDLHSETQFPRFSLSGSYESLFVSQRDDGRRLRCGDARDRKKRPRPEPCGSVSTV
jgi:hypothetical protein